MELTTAQLNDLESHSFTLGEIYNHSQSYNQLRWTCDDWTKNGGTKNIKIINDCIYVYDTYQSSQSSHLITKNELNELATIPQFYILKVFDPNLHSNNAMAKKENTQQWVAEALNKETKQESTEDNRWW